jgi:hypothetical protein
MGKINRAKLLTASKNVRLVLVIAGFAVVGVIATFLLRAAVPTASIEPEQGTLANGAQVVPSSGASGGQAIRFGTVTPPPPETMPAGFERWNDPAAWGGSVPAAGSNATVATNKKIWVDSDIPQLNTLTINANAEVRFADRPTTVSARAIIVYGKLAIGSETVPFTSNITIQLEGETVPVVRTIAGVDVGSNAMVAASGGTIDLHGKDSGRMYTKLSQTAAAGATSIQLVDAVTWKAGDKIGLSATTQDFTQYDESTVSSVSGDGKTVTLAAPLMFTHHSVVTTLTSGNETRSVEERGDVGLLTKNIKLTSAASLQSKYNFASATSRSTPADGFGGHTMCLAGSTMKVDNVEFAYMGQTGVLGRYPLHWHLTGDASSSYAKNTAIHHSFNRFVTVHATNNLRVDGGVWHDSVGHGFMYETGREVNNSINGILAMTTRVPPVAKQLRLSDDAASAFWITNPKNDMSNVIAAGGDGAGIWYDFNFNSDNGTEHDPDVNNRSQIFQTIDEKLSLADNLEAHSFKFIDRSTRFAENTRGDGISIEGYYGNVSGGRDIANNWSAWMNGNFGIWQDGAFTVRGVKAANNSVAWNGQDTHADGGILLVNSSHPNSNAADPCAAIRYYHGQADIENVWVGNYSVLAQNNCTEKAAVTDTNASGHDYTNRIKNIKFFGTGYKAVFHTPAYWGPHEDGAYSPHWFEDVDGSIKGDGTRAYVTNSRKFIKRTGETILYPNVGRDFLSGTSFGAYSVVGSTQGFAKFTIDESTPFAIQRLDTGVQGTLGDDVHNTAINLGVRYRMGAGKANAGFKIRTSDPGWFELEFPSSNNPNSGSYGGSAMRRATSEADLATGTQSAFYFNNGTLLVRIKINGATAPFGTAGDYNVMPGGGGWRDIRFN